MKETIREQTRSDKNSFQCVNEGSLTKDPELISESFNNLFTEDEIWTLF